MIGSLTDAVTHTKTRARDLRRLAPAPEGYASQPLRRVENARSGPSAAQRIGGFQLARCVGPPP